LVMAKFHYADFPVTSPSATNVLVRGSRRNGIWAKGDVTGLSRLVADVTGKSAQWNLGLTRDLKLNAKGLFCDFLKRAPEVDTSADILVLLGHPRTSLIVREHGKRFIILSVECSDTIAVLLC